MRGTHLNRASESFKAAGILRGWTEFEDYLAGVKKGGKTTESVWGAASSYTCER